MQRGRKFKTGEVERVSYRFASAILCIKYSEIFDTNVSPTKILRLLKDLCSTISLCRMSNPNMTCHSTIELRNK